MQQHKKYNLKTPVKRVHLDDPVHSPSLFNQRNPQGAPPMDSSLHYPKATSHLLMKYKKKVELLKRRQDLLMASQEGHRLILEAEIYRKERLMKKKQRILV